VHGYLERSWPGCCKTRSGWLEVPSLRVVLGTEMDDVELIRAFEDALHEFGNRLGGISELAASAACQATFGPVGKMTLSQRREVNRLLTSYGVTLEFPAPGNLKSV
jgi:hypothetical protein